MQGNLLARLGTTTLGTTKTTAKLERVNTTQLGPVVNPPAKTPQLHSTKLGTVSRVTTPAPAKTNTQLGPATNNITKTPNRSQSTLGASTQKSYLAVTFDGVNTLASKKDTSFYKPYKKTRPFSIQGTGTGLSGGAMPLPILPTIGDFIVINAQDLLLINPSDKFTT